jgi:hypothetical protein
MKHKPKKQHEMLTVEPLGSTTGTPHLHAHEATPDDIHVYRSLFISFFHKLKLCRTFRMSEASAAKRNAKEP